MSAAAPRAAGGWRHSMRWRLVAVFVLFALASTLLFLAGMRAIVHESWRGYGRPLVGGFVDLLVAEIGTPPDIARAQALAARLPIAIRIEGPRVQWQSAAEPAPLSPVPPHLGNHGERLWLVQRVLADGHRVSIGLARDPPGEPAALVPHEGGALILALLLLLTLSAYAYVRWLFKPLEAIRQGTERFGRGDFSRLIHSPRRDEIGALAHSVDTMAGEIARMLDAKRALLMSISHELRSPLTRARVHTELLDDGPPREALLRDLGQMRDLIDDLLESERLASGHAPLAREPVAVDALVRETLARHFADRPVQGEIAPDLPRFSLDAARMRLLLRNLVDNALRHGAAEGTQPTVTVQAVPGPDARTPALRLTVRDFGPGVPPDVLPRLSGAFFRADPARARTTGGVGLGLYLSRLVAEAHGGTLVLRPAAPGLEAEVTIPG